MQSVMVKHVKGWHMNENSQVPAPDAAVSARRRLVRGVFAAPAALTLYSGSAFAATSMSCVAKQVANPVSPSPELATSADNGGTDTYFRVQLRGKYKNANSNHQTPDYQSLWVKGSELAAAAPGGNAGYFIGTSDWYCYIAGPNSGYDTKTVYTEAQATKTAKGGTPALVNGFVAIRFDASGKVVGVIPATGSSAVSGSCWSSFKAAP